MFYWVSLVAHMVKNLTALQETWVRSLGQKDPLEKEMSPHSSICRENSMNRGAWQATVHGITKSWIQLRDFYFHFLNMFYCFEVRNHSRDTQQHSSLNVPAMHCS